MSTELETRTCSECPITFQVEPESRRVTCGQTCRRARERRVGVELETRSCPICPESFECRVTSSRVTCGKKDCVEKWTKICRLRAESRRKSYGKNKGDDGSRGNYSLETDPFLFSGMSTGCPGIRTWLCPEMMPFGYHDVGAVCVARRR
jgi:hypothetical protein